MALREIMRLEAQKARREKVRKKQLLTRSEFREHFATSEAGLKRMVVAGSVFAVDVDGVEYFPALLVAPTLYRRRLQSVCRILVPAPPWCRLDYLESKHENLGGFTPMELLSDNVRYRHLREMTHAWAGQWSRTVLTVYEGAYKQEPVGVNPIFAAADEVDPRIAVWTRVNGAIQAERRVTQTEPCVQVKDLTIFVKRYNVGNPAAISEVQLNVKIEESVARVCIQTGKVSSSDLVVVEPGDDVVDIVRRVLERRIQSKKL